MEANVRELRVPEFRDARGSLVALEELGEIVPFEVKRVYYIFDTPSDYIRDYGEYLKAVGRNR